MYLFKKNYMILPCKDGFFFMSMTECSVQLYILQLQGFEEPGKLP